MFKLRSQNKLRNSIEKQRPRLVNLAYSWCHDIQLSEDLVQDTCVKALERSSQLRDRNKIAGWLTRILVNAHRDYLRKDRDFIDVEDITLIELNTPASKVEQKDTVALVRHAVASLGDEQRKVLTLVDLSDFTYAEVASIMDIPIGTVMSRLCRARKRLKALLEEQQNEIRKTGLRRVK